MDGEDDGGWGWVTEGLRKFCEDLDCVGVVLELYLAFLGLEGWVGGVLRGGRGFPF